MPAIVLRSALAGARAASRSSVGSRIAKAAGIGATAYVIWDELWSAAKSAFGFSDESVAQVERVSSILASGLDLSLIHI